jgi:hypothetical protein
MKERSRRHMEEGLEAWRTSEGARIKMEDQTKLSSSLPRSSGPVSSLDSELEDKTGTMRIKVVTVARL